MIILPANKGGFVTTICAIIKTLKNTMFFWLRVVFISVHRLTLADLTLVIISVAGMFLEVTAKFSTFFSRAISVLLKDLKDKFIAQLVVSTDSVSACDTAAYFLGISFSNFCFCLSLVVLRLTGC